MNKKLLLIVGLILLVIVIAIVSSKKNGSASMATDEQQQLSADVSVEEGFLEAEQFINARAPIKIDDQTRLDKALAGPGDLMTYFYSLTTVTIEEVEPETILDNIKPKLLANLCSNADMQPVLQAGAKLVYVYSDKTGEEVGRIDVIAADC